MTLLEFVLSLVSLILEFISMVLALVSLVLALVSMVLALVSMVLALVLLVLALVSVVLALVSLVLALVHMATAMDIMPMAMAVLVGMDTGDVPHQVFPATKERRTHVQTIGELNTNTKQPEHCSLSTLMECVGTGEHRSMVLCETRYLPVHKARCLAHRT